MEDERSRMKTTSLIHPQGSDAGTTIKNDSPKLCFTNDATGLTMCQSKKNMTSIRTIVMIFIGVVIIILLMSLSIVVTVDGTVTAIPPFVSIPFVPFISIPISIGLGLVLAKIMKSRRV